MSRRGNCYDNAPMESFWGTLKTSLFITANTALGVSKSAGQNMNKGAIVVYESTVYPGATEEICIPLLERGAGLKWKEDFFVGYSPGWINPGDCEHTLTKILKGVSGNTPETLLQLAALYGRIFVPGVHCAASIKATEVAKVIESTQRDLNIALMNELAIVFDRLGIDTSEVLAAAGTKWNFLKFKPGLVGLPFGVCKKGFPPARV